jgi:hypothetical protein
LHRVLWFFHLLLAIGPEGPMRSRDQAGTTGIAGNSAADSLTIDRMPAGQACSNAGERLI